MYSDIFDYPLTKEEIWKFLIKKNLSAGKWGSFEKELNRLVQSEATPLGYNRKLYYLLGREEIVKKRIKRKVISRKKLEVARKIIRRLFLIPTVKFIGVSGGLALENSDEADDIDLFIITSKNTLWITRLILVLLLKLMGQYRGRGNSPIGGESNKACLNMLIDEKALMFEKSRQNLYTAHEIAQLKIIFDRNNTYSKFLSANKWILKYLPNSLEIKKLSNEEIKENKHDCSITKLLNYFAKVFQLWYMKNHKTNETVNDKMLAFHPFEYKNYVLEEYNKRMSKYEI